MTVNIEVMHDEVLSLLSNMERLDLIRLNTPVKDAVKSKEKLSERFAGSLQLSDSAYKAFQNTLQEGRSEWPLDIC